MSATKAPFSPKSFSAGEASPAICAPDAVHFKKDAVWKPLIRQFRRYLKKSAISSEIYAKIRQKSMKNQGALLCKHLNVPVDLANDP